MKKRIALYWQIGKDCGVAPYYCGFLFCNNLIAIRLRRFILELNIIEGEINEWNEKKTRQTDAQGIILLGAILVAIALTLVRF
jgi:hypothetical protein